MSKIDDLINELCPNGVEYRDLEKCCNILDNKRKPVTKSARESGKFPYYGANGIQDYVSDYIFDGKFVLVGEDGSVINQNGNPVVTWAEGKIWVNNHAHIIEEIDGILLRYLFHFIQTINVRNLIHGNIPKLNQGDFRKLQIAVPPLEVQDEIVRILDIFSNNIKELNKELLLREKQMHYIMQKLLNNSRFKEYKTLEEISNIEKGKTALQKSQPGEYPLVATTEFLQSSDTYQFDCEAVCLPLISARGHGVASITRIFYQKGKFALGNILCAIIPKDESVTAEYLRHYLFFYKDIILVPLMKGGANVSLTIDSLKKVKIAIPTIEEQNDIINKINIFSKILDNNKGLPAEIEARKKQYEYYRDKLLTFKELKVNEG